ncbi:MAG: hypothetical protein ACQERN_04950 [Thermodesulfobacteriota bacterium]
MSVSRMDLRRNVKALFKTYRRLMPEVGDNNDALPAAGVQGRRFKYKSEAE